MGGSNLQHFDLFRFQRKPDQYCTPTEKVTDTQEAGAILLELSIPRFNPKASLLGSLPTAGPEVEGVALP